MIENPYKVERKPDTRDLYYVCSPLRAETKLKEQINSKKAKLYEELVAEKYDCRAIAPHSFLPKYLDDFNREERMLAIKIGMEILATCKKLVICGDVISEGMQTEINFAKAHDIEVIELGLTLKAGD